MKLQYPFFKLTLLASLLSSFAAHAIAQQPSPPRHIFLTLSEPSRATLYPEIIYAGCIVPQWDRGYLLHLEINKDSALVTMYDRNGKKVLEARPGPPNAAKFSLRTVAVTHAGGILAAGGGIMTDGSLERFIARTDPAGRTVQSLSTGRFLAYYLCEASDGTVWALGLNDDFHVSRDAKQNILSHFSFERGLLGSYMALDSFAKVSDFFEQIANPGRSYISCRKDRISVYLAPAAQYIQLDPGTQRLSRWNVDQSLVVASKSLGFAVTEEGKIFAALADYSGSEGKRRHGLYELKATHGSL